MARTPRPLSPTDITQFLPLDGCRRFLRFRLHPREAQDLLERYDLRLEKLSVLLKERGEAVEARVVDRLRAAGHRVVDLTEATPDEAAKALASCGPEPTHFFQVKLLATLHGWPFGGRADLLRIERKADGLHLLAADVKASRRDKVEHRLQVAFYARMVEATLAAQGERVARMEGAVIRLAEDGSEADVSAGVTDTFDLAPYLHEIDTLLAPGGVVDTVSRTPLTETPFHLSQKCDSCLYNGICFVESADREDVSLVPFLTPGEKAALANAGVRTLPQLAEVKALPGPKDYGIAFAPGEGMERVAETLSRDPRVAASLDRLNQRARRILAGLRRGAPFYAWLLDPAPSLLPSTEKYPDLVQVFLDAQHDYLQDRLYLASALVKGPKGEFPVAVMMEAPPTDEDEAALLAAFVLRILDAARKAAGADEARVHFYLYDPRDQRVLLDALRRHLTTLTGAPLVYDLLTNAQAVGEPMVSFLAHEVRERTNLPLTSHNLMAVASYTWVDDKNFTWSHGEIDYRQKFRAGLFDGHRSLVRGADGRLRAPADGEAPKGAARVRVESASRFGSQVPLEYAYATWGILPRSLEWDDKVFRGVTRDDLLTLAFLRVKALAHIERSFKFRNDHIEKTPIPLGADATAPPREPGLHEVLTDFLHFEHHAREQELLAHYALPAVKRVETGRTLMGRLEAQKEREFTLRLEGGDLSRCRLKEGDWVVVNRVEDPRRPTSPGRVASGHLARIVALSEERALLQGVFSGAATRFKRHHYALPVHLGALYTLDEMVDDLNADKVLEALRNAAGNPLYRLLTQGLHHRYLSDRARDGAARFLQAVDALEAPRQPTGPQRRFIADTLEGPIHLLQGPPGTGKSHTTGWAILARAVAQHAEGRTFRAFVTAKTHSAIRVLLASITSKKRKFLDANPNAPLRHLLVAKSIGDGDEDLPDGVYGLNGYDKPERVGPTIGAPSLVLGATPGGLLTLLKRHHGGAAPWDEPLFDLVVIDEASQMGIPEALLACAFLKPDGQILIVGDHRQMPPILAHDWDNEARRSVLDRRPYASIFEHLYENGFPRVGLEESFRLHEIQAEFLAENIYAKDGLKFFSRRRDLIPAHEHADPFVAAVLDPAYPVVVVEHEECASEQSNPTEAALMAPILDALQELGLDGHQGVGVVVPHRAQKGILRARHRSLAAAGAIDTVERFQGDERDVILVTATASDPECVAGEAEFLLNPNRLNVALSRPRKKLIVVASRTVFHYLARDPDLFEQAGLWKRLRYQFASEPLWEGELAGTRVRITGRRAAGAGPGDSGNNKA